MDRLLDTNFTIQEFVPPETYAKWGKNSIWFIDPNVVLFAQWLKDNTNGAITVINDWYWGGDYKYSGYRPPDCDVGAKESSHRRGIAIDVKVKGYTSDQIRKLIESNFGVLNELFGVTGFELDTEGWVHVDFRWTGMDKIFKISYK